jgi:hypothetical protein
LWSIDLSFLTNLVANDQYELLTQPNPTHQNPKISDPIQPMAMSGMMRRNLEKDTEKLTKQYA